MGNESHQKNTTVTTSELAKHLGLSRWTVSRVINGHEGVLPETVERVREGMAELGFQPNALARSLRGGKTGSIGVCFQEIDSPILARKVSILQQLLRDQGYHALIELTNYNHDLEVQIIRHFLSMKVEGIVLIGSMLREEDDITGILKRQQLPVIRVDPVVPTEEHEVSIERGYSMKVALEHLFEQGHRKFGVIGFDPEIAYAPYRLAGLQKAAKDFGLSYEEDFDCYFEAGSYDHGYDMGYQLAGQLLEKAKVSGTPLPTAVIAINDRVAIGALKRLKEAGKRVPDDVALMGYDDLDVSTYVTPPLTTMDHRAEALMETAAEKLFQLMQNPEAETSQMKWTIKPELIVRESTTSPVQ